MCTRRRCSVGVLAAFLLFGLTAGCGGDGRPPESAASGEATACAITVQPAASIQAAIDAAPEGAVICLAEGVWEEHLTIGKSLTLRGEGAGKTTIRGYDETHPVIHVTTPERGTMSVVLNDLSVTGGTGWSAGDGLRIEGGVRASLQGVIVEDNDSYGLRLSGDAVATITNCTLRGNRDGLYLWEAAQASLELSTVEGSERYGIMMLQSARISLQASSIVDNGMVGIGMDHSTHAVIEDSSITGHTRGIYMMRSSAASVGSSTIQGNREDGIFVLDRAQATIRDSLIASNGNDGVRVRDSAHVTITDSIISDNRTGVYIMGDAQVVVEEATIEGNTTSGVATSGTVQATIRNSSIRRSRFGISIASELHQVTLEGMTVEQNQLGITIGESSRAMIRDSLIADNAQNGVFLVFQGEAIIERTTIRTNGHFGVAVLERPCVDRDREFAGYIAGFANIIPSPQEEGGNAEGAVCPVELAFLMTAEGGAMDRRD